MSKVKLSPRRMSRSLAVQGLYHFQTNPKSVSEIEDFLHSAHEEFYNGANYELMHFLLDTATNDFDYWVALFAEFSTRKADEIETTEKAILAIAAVELEQNISVPAPVVINEAVELAKLYGGEESFKFINGLVDKLAFKLRNDEMVLAKTRSSRK